MVMQLTGRCFALGWFDIYPSASGSDVDDAHKRRTFRRRRRRRAGGKSRSPHVCRPSAENVQPVEPDFEPSFVENAAATNDKSS